MNPTARHQVTVPEVRRVIRESGLSARCICLHSSFRSFGSVTGGPGAIIDAFLDEECTIVVPTFSWDAYAAAPGLPRPDRNGTDYDAWLRSAVVDDSGQRFTPESNEIDLGSMGVVAATLLRRDHRVRGDHPLCSFTAVGPHAAEIVAGQTADAVFSPLKRVAERRGVFVLAGVGLDRLTAVHVAEQVSGRSMFVRWARVPTGVVPVRVGGCSDGFDRLAPALSACERHALVGQSRWRIFDAQSLVDGATEAILADPLITACSDPGCLRCADAIAGGPVERAPSPSP